MKERAVNIDFNNKQVANVYGYIQSFDIYLWIAYINIKLNVSTQAQ